MQIISDLNRDQLDSLSKLNFDMAKVAFGLAILPVATPRTIFIDILRLVMALFLGIAFTYAGLLLLKLKERGK